MIMNILNQKSTHKVTNRKAAVAHKIASFSPCSLRRFYCCGLTCQTKLRTLSEDCQMKQKQLRTIQELLLSQRLPLFTCIRIQTL